MSEPGISWTIRWGDNTRDAYVYGTEITKVRDGEIKFRNELMPPGTIIKEWYSKTNFGRQHLEPSLPIIDGEGRYRFVADMDVPDDEMCLIRFVFYDRFENECGSIAFDEKAAEFTCPLQTYSYRLQLVNGGVTVFWFRQIVIEEIIG